MSPLENRAPPMIASFLYPKHFRRAPLNNPRVIPSAEFKLRIRVASRAVMLSALNLSLKMRPKLVRTGTMST